MKENENNTRIEKGINELRERYQAVQVLPRLKKKYGERIGREILSVRMYQTSRSCYLKICKEITKFYQPIHRNK